ATPPPSGPLDDSERTVGVHIDLSHDAPTPPHRMLTLDVELTAVDGRRLTFAVKGRDEEADICRGTHQRTVVHLARFESRAHGRASARPGPTWADLAGPRPTLADVC